MQFKINGAFAHNEIFVPLFPSNSFVVANKRPKNLPQLIVRFNPCNIKMDLLDQTEHRFSTCRCKYDTCDNFLLEKTSITCHGTGGKFKVWIITKNGMYLA